MNSIECFETRLLYPFTFSPTDLDGAMAALKALEWNRRRVWSAAAHAPPLCIQELNEELGAHLFGTAPGSGRYLRAEPATAGAWLKKTSVVRFHGGADTHIAWIPGLWFELFLSPQGAGVLSLALEPKWTVEMEPDGARLRVKALNYRLAQMRAGTTPEIYTPHPRDNPALAAKIAPDTPPPPEPDAPLEDRLGALGASVTLPEICDYVLGPLFHRHRAAHVQNQFSVYAAVKLDAAVTFRNAVDDGELGPFLTGLAQVEESSHAGTSSAVVETAVLNPKHFVAASCLGVVHAVADQASAAGEEDHGFNAQRIPLVREKYFSPFLLAYLQRLVLTRIRDEIVKLVHGGLSTHGGENGDESFTAQFARLRQQLLIFAVSGHATETSPRQVLNYYYALVQRALGVRQSLDALRRAVEDIALDQSSRHAAEEAAKQRESLEIMAATQTKVEWIEIFVISTYAAELTKTIAELEGFPSGFAGHTVPLWAFGAALAAMIGLKPWKHAKGRVLTWRRLLAVIAVLVLATLWTIRGVVARDAQPNTGEGQKSPAAAEQKPNERVERQH